MLFKYRMWFEKIKESVEKDVPLFGTWITIGHPEVVEILSRLPFDWFVFDMEHAPLEVPIIETMLMAIKDTEIIPIVRVPWNDPVVIKRVLDLGVAGVIVPLISSKEDAVKAVEAVRYPLSGIRGTGPRRCVMYGFENVVEYFYNWNKYAITIAQVETKRAYENLEDVISLEGITGVFVGPSDLSASLGMYSMIESEEFINVLADIARRAKTYRKLIGLMAHTLSIARKAVELGYNFVSLAHDTKFLIEGAKRFLSEFKK